MTFAMPPQTRERTVLERGGWHEHVWGRARRRIAGRSAHVHAPRLTGHVPHHHARRGSCSAKTLCAKDVLGSRSDTQYFSLYGVITSSTHAICAGLSRRDEHRWIAAVVANRWVLDG
jgi:hypothetical protein